MQTLLHRHRGFYDALRFHQEPKAAGLKVGRHRVARPMRTADLKDQIRRGFKPFRTAAPLPDRHGEPSELAVQPNSHQPQFGR